MYCRSSGVRCRSQGEHGSIHCTNAAPGITGMTSSYALWRYLFWPPFAGLLFLVIGLIAVRRQLSATLDAVPVLGRVFVPVALAAFAAEHFTSAENLMKMVPSWMPARLFWAYFVGVALIAAATSISLGKQVRLSAPLLGSMFFIFVL